MSWKKLETVLSHLKNINSHIPYKESRYRIFFIAILLLNGTLFSARFINEAFCRRLDFRRSMESSLRSASQEASWRSAGSFPEQQLVIEQASPEQFLLHLFSSFASNLNLQLFSVLVEEKQSNLGLVFSA